MGYICIMSLNVLSCIAKEQGGYFLPAACKGIPPRKLKIYGMRVHTAGQYRKISIYIGYIITSPLLVPICSWPYHNTKCIQPNFKTPSLIVPTLFKSPTFNETQAPYTLKTEKLGHGLADKNTCQQASDLSSSPHDPFGEMREPVLASYSVTSMSILWYLCIHTHTHTCIQNNKHCLLHFI